MFLVFLFLAHLTRVVSLDCYQCTDIRNVSDCHTLVVCPADHLCSTESSRDKNQELFNLTCKPKQDCLTTITTTTPPSAGSTGTLNTDCSQCCGNDACNKVLCSAGTQTIGGSGPCQDDSTFNCPQISTLYNLCADVQHAKTVCRNFCGLCDLVDGGWSLWNAWSNCDVSCNNGTMTRTRTCTNPSPAHGGSDCPGQNKQTSPCYMPDCPISGGWSAWSPWGSCSVSCSVGLQRRDRSCSNPYPERFGDHCFGDDKVYKSCFDRSCSDGAWSSWSAWGTCSATCNGGLQSRTRTCTNPAPSTFGRDCRGNDAMQQSCNTNNCPATDGAWSSWSAWGTCSATCNGGLQSRTRTCTNPAPSTFGRDCRGNDFMQQSCNTNNCPATDGAWSSWSAWGTCSATCNGGLQSRTRTCTNPAPSTFGRDCRGNDAMQQLCNTKNCPDKKVGFSVYYPHSALTGGGTPTFSVTIFNTGSYSSTTGRFTCPVAGLYSFSLTLRSRSSSATAYVFCRYRINGTRKSWVNTSNDPYGSASGTMIADLSVGDVVDLGCYGWEHVYTYYDTKFSGVLITPA